MRLRSLFLTALAAAPLLLPVSASAHFAGIVSFDALTGDKSKGIPTVYHRVKDGTIEKYVTPEYTDNLGVLNMTARDHDLLVLRGRYADGYECQAKLDMNKCHQVNHGLQNASNL